eukprot:gene42982-64069_t
MQVYIETDEGPPAGVEVPAHGTVADLRNATERALEWTYFDLRKGSLFLLEDGSIQTCVWRLFGLQNIPDLGGRRVVAISCRSGCSVVVLDDGNVLGWGRAGFSRAQPSFPDRSGRHAAAVSMGGSHALILYRDGGAAAWYTNDAPPDLVSDGGRDFPAAERRITHVAAGDGGSSVFLLNNGEVLTCGGMTTELCIEDPEEEVEDEEMEEEEDHEEE